MSDNNKKILFILPVSTQPRFAKRINHFISNNYNVTVLSFERTYFHLNKLPRQIKYIKLGKIKSGNYISRIPKLLLSIFKIIKYSLSSDIIYIFSKDILFLPGIFLNKNKIIYEIGDLRFTRNKFINLINYYIERYLFSKISQIIVTSQGFNDYLIKDYKLDNNKIKIVENKLPISFFNKPESFQIIEQPFVLGVVGFFRYEILLELIKSFNKNDNNKFQIKLFGGGPLLPKLQKYFDDNNIIYYGQFQNPVDLKKIYNSIDVSFVMYDSTELNVKLAIPNKLYESAFFRKPIIVSSNTYLEKQVLNLGIGFSWDIERIDDLIKFLNSQDFIRYYNSLSKNFEKIGINQLIQ